MNGVEVASGVGHYPASHLRSRRHSLGRESPDGLEYPVELISSKFAHDDTGLVENTVNDFLERAKPLAFPAGVGTRERNAPGHVVEILLRSDARTPIAAYMFENSTCPDHVVWVLKDPLRDTEAFGFGSRQVVRVSEAVITTVVITFPSDELPLNGGLRSGKYIGT
jgi:hypothetical protein